MELPLFGTQLQNQSRSGACRRRLPLNVATVAPNRHWCFGRSRQLVSASQINTTLSSESLEPGTGGSNSLRSRQLAPDFEAFSEVNRKRRACRGDAPPHRHRRELTCRVVPRHFDFLSVGEEFGVDCTAQTHHMVEICGHRKQRTTRCDILRAPQ
jgi:hypothetical protein